MTVDVRELDAKLVTHEINVTDYLEWLDETGHTETLEQVERFALSRYGWCGVEFGRWGRGSGVLHFLDL